MLGSPSMTPSCRPTIPAPIDSIPSLRETVESNIVRTCDANAAERMIALIEKGRSEGNSVGGVSEWVVRGVPPGATPYAREASTSATVM